MVRLGWLDRPEAFVVPDIDDYAGNLREWEANGGIAIRFSKELESHGFKVINRLDTLLDMFDKNGELI